MGNKYNSSSVEWLVDDAILQLNALNAAPLTDGRVFETDRTAAMYRLSDLITEIDNKRPKGLWDSADKFQKLKTDFEALREKERTRPRWSPPRYRVDIGGPSVT